MVTLFVLLTIAGVLLLAAGFFVRPIWRVTVRPFYRNPDAIEPSELGFRMRSGVIIVTGIIVMVVSIVEINLIMADQPTPKERTAESCGDIVDNVGHPTSSSEAAKAVKRAAADAGYRVDSDETSEDESLDVAGEEHSITITTTTWSVTDDEQEIVQFQWTESETVHGRFSSSDC